MAASQDDNLALNFLGAHAYNVKHNETEAVQYFRRAAKNGTCDRALNNLGLCFENGIGECQQDFITAISYYDKAAKLGYAPAFYNKAHLLFKMARTTDSLFDRESYMFDCVHSLRLCLDENDHLMDAHFMMGFLYEKGIQVDKNLS